MRCNLQVKEAIQTAKEWLADTLSDENLTDVGLEEINFEESKKLWRVTLGFSRPWDLRSNALTAVIGGNGPKRAYKVITVTDDGRVLDMAKAPFDR